jgi:3-oxoacyl-[acyl-carrier protein] reductase
MARELEGKVALVTGASRGLGVQMAVRLARGGALVAVNYASDEAAAKTTVRRIEDEGGKAFIVQAKLSGEVAAQELAAKLETDLVARTGSNRLDILVNNIGGGDYGPISDADEAMYDQMFNNNVKGPFFLTRALYDRINDYGRIINISSMGARLTDPNIIVYTMAKMAVEGFTRVLAQDVGKRGITVNSVAPGFTAGPTNDHIANDPVAARQVTDVTALNRFGTPEEIADVVYFLASPAGRWVTAQHIEASGGFRL